ncbi:maltooligosyltrehalose synthase [Streptomyces lydicamycinicus]|uniref:Maltooligosyltrehalose synthase n=1 Tax=Streptomyces lydicamycinicus TaxID=1546107 RepID=A0A0P4R8D2_9ACTN|nr:maltooligosyltrehalose synthase [Streptomyces lydicamycinicus]
MCVFYGSIPEKCGQCGKSALQLRDQLLGEIREFISHYPVPLAAGTRPDAVQEITHRYLDPGGDAAGTGDWRPPVRLSRHHPESPRATAMPVQEFVTAR